METISQLSTVSTVNIVNTVSYYSNHETLSMHNVTFSSNIQINIITSSTSTKKM